MAKGTNQKLKLSYLTRIMLEETDDEHALTMPQIIDELEKYDITAERKSIYADFEDMRDKLGIEIIKEQRGRETYYHVGAREFELAEVKLLIDAIQSSKFITEKKSKELIKKVKGFVSKYQAAQLQRQVFVQGRTKTINENIYYNVDDIYTAIAKNRKIEFRYFSWNVDKSKHFFNHGGFITVSPWALTWDDENYYLVAFDDYSKSCKHYRVDKMLELKVIDEEREGDDTFKDFDVAAYSKATFGMYSGNKTRVKIRFKNNLCGVFIDRFGRDISFRKVDDEFSEFEEEVYVSPQFFGWIFSLGKDVKIIAPDSVVDKLKSHAFAFMSNYQGL